MEGELDRYLDILDRYHRVWCRLAIEGLIFYQLLKKDMNLAPHFNEATVTTESLWGP